jgi:hypothetical protein
MNKISNEGVAQIRALRVQGHSFLEIERITGFSNFSARNYCRGIVAGIPSAEVRAARALAHQQALARRRASRKPRPGKFTDRQILIAMAVLEGKS